MYGRSVPSTPRTLGATMLAAVVAALIALAATPAHAAKPPVDRTYLVTLVGLDESYEPLQRCLTFTETELCSLDGETCGVWWYTEPAGAESAIAFSLAFFDPDGVWTEVIGTGRLDSRGGRISSLGGAGHVTADGATGNFSFAARQTAPKACEKLLDSAPAITPPPPPAPGTVTESRPVQGFHEVRLTGVGHVVIDQTGSESLTVTAEPDILPLLTSEVIDGALFLGTRPGAELNTDKGILFRLTVKTLDTVDVSGVGFVEIRDLQTPSLDVGLTGVATVVASGTSGRQDLFLSGVGTYWARHLKSRFASVDVSGIAEAVVDVSEELRGSVRGPSVVKYAGNPSVVDVTVSDFAVLRKID